jgi:hypothetical protein
MGYTQVPNHSTSLEATAPNLNLTVLEKAEDGGNLRIVVSAPMDRAVKGSLRLTTTGGSVDTAEHQVDLAPGKRCTIYATAVLGSSLKDGMRLTATLTGPDLDLRTTARFP